MLTTNPTDYLWQETHAMVKQTEAALHGLTVYMDTVSLGVALLAAAGLMMIGLLAWQDARSARMSRRTAGDVYPRRGGLPAGAEKTVGSVPVLRAA